MDLPEKIEPGGAIEQKITSSLINKMLRAIRSCTPPESVKGARIGKGPNGWTLALNPGSRSSSSFPLQPVQSAADKVRFRYGTVHGLVPQIAAVALTTTLEDPANPELTITADGVIYVKVDLAADTYEAENPVLAYVAGTAGDIPADVARVSAHQLLASVTFADGSITGLSSAHQGSIDVASCAGVTNYWDLG